MNTTLSRRRTQRGMTLVECAMALSMAAVLTGLAAPSFSTALQRRHLEGAAAQLATDIHYTRTLAVSRNAPLRISFEASASASCYVIHTGAASQCSCDADGTAVCQAGATAERSVRFAAGDSVGLKTNVRSILFDPVRGTSTPTATLQLVSRNAGAIHQVMNITGRVRSCSPAPAIAGYKKC
jgi:type IV fimbrial biogenesis protein FimT